LVDLNLNELIFLFFYDDEMRLKMKNEMRLKERGEQKKSINHHKKKSHLSYQSHFDHFDHFFSINLFLELLVYIVKHLFLFFKRNEKFMKWWNDDLVVVGWDEIIKWLVFSSCQFYSHLQSHNLTIYHLTISQSTISSHPQSHLKTQFFKK